MKTLVFILASIFCFVSCQNKKVIKDAVVDYSDTIKFRCATLEEATELISAEDTFTQHRSPFDIVSRVQNPNATVEDLTNMMLGELGEWTDFERSEIARVQNRMNRIIEAEQFKLKLPKEILLVKTSMKDEGSALGYTRSKWIAIAGDLFLDKFTQRRDEIFVHEVFHILTRNNHDFKREMYKTIGFTVLDEDLEYPEDLKDMHISNPDVDSYDSYGEFTVNGNKEKLAMYLYADRPYTEGLFFDYVNIGFIPYDEDMHVKKDAGGNTIVYNMKEVTDFFDKVGRNTGYLLNPEEILAENFVMAFLNYQDRPTQELTNRIREVLKGNSTVGK